MTVSANKHQCGETYMTNESMRGPELVRAGWQMSSPEERREIWEYVFGQFYADVDIGEPLRREREEVEACEPAPDLEATYDVVLWEEPGAFRVTVFTYASWGEIEKTWCFSDEAEAREVANAWAVELKCPIQTVAVTRRRPAFDAEAFAQALLRATAAGAPPRLEAEDDDEVPF